MLYLSLAIKGAVILAVASGATAVLRTAPAALRHGVWVVAFVALLALPALALFGPQWEVPVLPAEREDAVAPTPAVAAGTPLAPVGVPSVLPTEEPVAWTPAPAAATPAPLAPEAVPSAPAPPAPLAHEASAAPAVWSGARVAQTLLVIWAVGAVGFLLGWLGTLLAARHLVRTSRPEHDPEWLDALEHARLLTGVERPVQLVRTDALEIPIAWGLGRAAIVLPQSADEWDESRREAVLLHEMAHLRRGDAGTQLVAQIAVALHWFDPLAWWAYRRFLVEREHACDDAVLRTGARPSVYATHLVDIARRVKRERMVLAAVSPMARQDGLEGRVRSILADRRRGAPSRTWSLTVAAIGLAVVLPLAACTLTAPRASETPAPAPVASPSPAPAPKAPAPPPAPRAAVALAVLDSLPTPDVLIAPALETALAEVRALQASEDWEDVDWDEIEITIEEAFADAQIDWDDALAEIREGLAEIEFDGHSPEARAALAEAMAQVRSELASLGRDDMNDALREAQDARREAMREQEHARREAKHEQREALREAQEAVREAQEEARREAQEARREAQEEARRDVERAREERRREREEANRRRADKPRGYSFSISTNGRTTRVTSGTGASAWSEAVSAWETGLASITEWIPHASGDEVKDLEDAIDGMAGGLEGLEQSANGWARSAAEKRIVSQRLARSRSALASARQAVADAACTD